MANLDPDGQDEDVRQWLADIEPLIKMNQEFAKERSEQQSSDDSEGSQ